MTFVLNKVVVRKSDLVVLKQQGVVFQDESPESWQESRFACISLEVSGSGDRLDIKEGLSLVKHETGTYWVVRANGALLREPLVSVSALELNGSLGLTTDAEQD